MTIKKFIFTHEDAGYTLLNFIDKKLTLSKNKAKQIVDRRQVFVNKKRTWIASYQLNEGDIIEVFTEETRQSKFQEGFILFNDNHYLIVSKPPGILTNGPNSLENDLKAHFNDNHIQVVHRLDKDTSGVVIFARDKDAFEQMKILFKRKLIKKVYRVIVRGGIGKQTFTIDTPIHGQKAVTHVRLLKRGKEASYLEVETETGRKHQIRIHLASVGYPVIGETEYDRNPIENPLLRQTRRQMLHAYQISFDNPYTHTTVSDTADITTDFNQHLKL